MTRPGLRLLATVLLRLACLLAVVTLALAVGFAAGWGAHITLAASSHHRWMAPSVPGGLAFYEPPTTSPTLPGVEAAPDRALVRPDPAARAGGGQDRRARFRGRHLVRHGPGLPLRRGRPGAARRRLAGLDGDGAC